MSNYKISGLAWGKAMIHATANASASVFGLLVGTTSAGQSIISDSFPVGAGDDLLVNTPFLATTRLVLNTTYLSATTPKKQILGVYYISSNPAPSVGAMDPPRSLVDFVRAAVPGSPALLISLVSDIADDVPPFIAYTIAGSNATLVPDTGARGSSVLFTAPGDDGPCEPAALYRAVRHVLRVVNEPPWSACSTYQRVGQFPPLCPVLPSHNLHFSVYDVVSYIDDPAVDLANKHISDIIVM